MAGVVYLGGGGTGQDEALLWGKMLAGCQRLLYWPFALEGGMLAGAETWLRDQVARLGFSVEIRTWTALEGKHSADLDGFDLLFVGGGNTFLLLHHLQAHGFIGPVRQWVEAGGDYYGGSAGAILATDSIEIADHADSNDVGLVDLAGLGLLPAVGLFPHYTTDQKDLVHSISRDLARPVSPCQRQLGSWLPRASSRPLVRRPYGRLPAKPRSRTPQAVTSSPSTFVAHQRSNSDSRTPRARAHGARRPPAPPQVPLGHQSEQGTGTAVPRPLLLPRRGSRPVDPTQAMEVRESDAHRAVPFAGIYLCAEFEFCLPHAA